MFKKLRQLLCKVLLGMQSSAKGHHTGTNSMVCECSHISYKLHVHSSSSHAYAHGGWNYLLSKYTILYGNIVISGQRTACCWEMDSKVDFRASLQWQTAKH